MWYIIYHWWEKLKTQINEKIFQVHEWKNNIGKIPTLSKQSTDFKKSLSKFQWCFSKELGGNKHEFDIESQRPQSVKKI